MFILAAAAFTAVLFAVAVAALWLTARWARRRIADVVAELRWRRRLRAELPDDWWERFEADLRAYMSRAWRAAREAERRV